MALPPVSHAELAIKTASFERGVFTLAQSARNNYRTWKSRPEPDSHRLKAERARSRSMRRENACSVSTASCEKPDAVKEDRKPHTHFAIIAVQFTRHGGSQEAIFQ